MKRIWLMAEQFSEISEELAQWISEQKIFFTATAAPNSRVNLSPREGSALRVLGPNAIVYLDKTGSGNETAAHLKADGRMTIMLCSVEGPPRILRLFGQGRVIHRDSNEYDKILQAEYEGTAPPGARQIIHLRLDLAQTSCGFGVPLFSFERERDVLVRWAAGKGEAGISAYWAEKNQTSIDGLPTGILDAPEQ
jgi:hypothetical protein